MKLPKKIDLVVMLVADLLMIFAAYYLIVDMCISKPEQSFPNIGYAVDVSVTPFPTPTVYQKPHVESKEPPLTPTPMIFIQNTLGNREAFEPEGCSVIFVPTNTQTPSPTHTCTPTPKPKPNKSTSSERDILARCVQAEAASQGFKGKALVARVILNRVKSADWPNDIKSVIYQQGQFAVVRNGSINRVKPDKETYEAVDAVLNGWDESKGATYFRMITPTRTEWHFVALTHLYDYGEHAFFKD